ncbi:HAD-IA family hydrolase [Pseudoroseicyclus sp. CXY001]|uniref:HAD-IA family hydrolase n=1 Tax=Pseudoroseicyclus sp. CXY001 TaxID=3242492 RepID=UPI00357112BF
MRLVIFDVDGTLVDSAAHIHAAMSTAYTGLGLSAPAAAATRAIIGLSLPHAFLRLSPEHEEHHEALLDGYKAAFAERRIAEGAAASPLFPGAREALDALAADPQTLLAVATGKSRRGLRGLIEVHGLEGVFVSAQTADDHPSKPHPAMIEAALAETGIPADQAVMVGDTSFDMDMARAAGIAAIGVTWGYHAPESLGADRLIGRFAELPAAVAELIGEPA